MNYEDALKEWGALRLEKSISLKPHSIDRNTVIVEMEFDEGYACCNGRDPDCYCSFAESPSAKVRISGKPISRDTHLFLETSVLKGLNSRIPQRLSVSIDSASFDFATILGEIVEAANGVVTDLT